MSRAAKLALAAATVLPALLFAGLMSRFSGPATNPMPADPFADRLWMHDFQSMMHFIQIFVLWMVVMVIIYAIHMYRSPRVPDGRRAFWLVALVLGTLITMAIYWWVIIWKEPQPRTAA